MKRWRSEKNTWREYCLFMARLRTLLGNGVGRYRANIKTTQKGNPRCLAQWILESQKSRHNPAPTKDRGRNEDWTTKFHEEAYLLYQQYRRPGEILGRRSTVEVGPRTGLYQRSNKRLFYPRELGFCNVNSYSVYRLPKPYMAQ